MNAATIVKAEKQRLKALAKEEKLRLKALAKEEKQRLKALEKAEKQRLIALIKEEKKKQKAYRQAQIRARRGCIEHPFHTLPKNTLSDEPYDLINEDSVATMAEDSLQYVPSPEELMEMRQEQGVASVVRRLSELGVLGYFDRIGLSEEGFKVTHERHDLLPTEIVHETNEQYQFIRELEVLPVPAAEIVYTPAHSGITVCHHYFDDRANRLTDGVRTTKVFKKKWNPQLKRAVRADVSVRTIVSCKRRRHVAEAA